MRTLKPTRRIARPEAQQVFRQLAWNIAGTLASGKAGKASATRRRSGGTRTQAARAR